MTKDDPTVPGLLAKMAKFVLQPNRDWAQLDQSDGEPENSYSKETLKAMIERKRQNDFVRKREFDQLRKIRRRDDPVRVEQVGQASFFQTSLPSNFDERAKTLKKIDEIEAQMSRQWWKGKQIGQLAASQPSPLQTDMARGSPDTDFAPTEATVPYAGTDLRTDFSPTSTEPDADVAAQSGQAAASQTYQAGINGALGVLQTDGKPIDALLEAAAIRFANGDFAQAQESLRGGIGDASSPQAAQRMRALLDLYQATGQKQEFEKLAQEFAILFSRARPLWPSVDSQKDPAAVWISPVELTAASLEFFQTDRSSPAKPLYLDWRLLRSFSTDAVAPLGRLMAQWCRAPVQLGFRGHGTLDHALKALTPTLNAQIATSNWQLRLDALRLMGLQDEFELVALEYALTYGERLQVKAPTWSPAAGRCEIDAYEQRPAAGASTRSLAAGEALFWLKGEVLGDSAEALSVLKQSVKASRQGRTGQAGLAVDVDCSGLVRIDFPAAGGLLSWAAECQAQSQRIRFINANRLIAAFFNVIGLSDHAQVVCEGD